MKYLVGVYLPDFCDQDYLRARDEWITAENEKDAINIWTEGKKHWLASDERHLAKVLERR